jgi:hypothetical protein
MNSENSHSDPFSEGKQYITYFFCTFFQKYLYINKYLFIYLFLAGRWWLTPVMLATQEAEIRRIMVQSQPRQIVCETLSQKHPTQKRAGGVAQATSACLVSMRP